MKVRANESWRVAQTWEFDIEEMEGEPERLTVATRGKAGILFIDDTETSEIEIEAIIEEFSTNRNVEPLNIVKVGSAGSVTGGEKIEVPLKMTNSSRKKRVPGTLWMLGPEGHRPKEVKWKSFDRVTEKSMCMSVVIRKADLPEAYKMIEDKFDKKEMQEAREIFKIILKDKVSIKINTGWSLQKFGKKRGRIKLLHAHQGPKNRWADMVRRRPDPTNLCGKALRGTPNGGEGRI